MRVQRVLQNSDNGLQKNDLQGKSAAHAASRRVTLQFAGYFGFAARTHRPQGTQARTPSAPSEAGALQEVKVLYLEGLASHQGIESWTEVGND